MVALEANIFKLEAMWNGYSNEIFASLQVERHKNNMVMEILED